VAEARGLHAHAHLTGSGRQHLDFVQARRLVVPLEDETSDLGHPREPILLDVDEIAELIRSRRTHKSFGPDPVPRELLDELLELARWAPNHHRTNPWRFRVLGPETLARLKEAAGPGEAPKLDRAPTLVVASAVLSGDLEQDEEDVCATAAAIYAVLLAAHARGLAGYWRTPAVLRTKEGREAVGLPDGERFLGLIHLGSSRGKPPAPERAPLDAYRTFLP
jgi:nitroreductase